MSVKPIKFFISVGVALALVIGSAAAANALVIYVRVVADNNRSLSIDSEPSETVLNIKQKISLVENIAPSRQILTFAGRTLDDSQTLSDLNIQSQATFNLTLAPLLCEVGTFSTTGNQPCDPAPIGRFVAVLGSVQAVPCEPGTYQNQTGQSACLEAAVGYFVDSAGASAQQACPAGYTSGARAIACTPVQAVLCSVGTFSSTGNTPCDPAGAGRFVSVTGARSATPCLPGTFQNLTGQSSCLQATAGYFVDTSGAISQLPCPIGTTSLAGATVCVSNIAMPILVSLNPAKSLVISGYSPAATTLTAAMKSKTKAFVSANASMTKLKCVGDVAGVGKSNSQVKLATSRAKAACSYAKSLNKKLSVSYSGKQSKTSGKISRSVLFTLAP